MPTRKSPAKAKPARATDSLLAHLNDAVSEALASLPGIGRRKMLVSFGWTVKDRVFALVSRQGRVVVRLPDEEVRRELLALDGAGPWKYSAKAPPRDWLLLPESMAEDAEQLRAWLRRAWQLGQDAPAKPARKRPRTAAAPRRKR
jgi:TfoX/Sxy family transcriptional regulator of competence genes